MHHLIQTLSETISTLFRQQFQKRADSVQRRLYINQTVENVIDNIDPRLRSIMGYKKALYPCVENVLSYAEKVCTHLPGPILCSRENHRTNATVHSIFSDHKKMAETFSQCQKVQEYFKDNPLAENVYLVLGMKITEKTTLGMELQGDIIIKDVMQTNVVFDNYLITHPSTDEESLRFNLRERALHECVAQTIKKLLATETYNNQLEESEIKLRMQLNMLKNKVDGLGSVMLENDEHHQSIHQINMKLKEIDHKQGEISKDVGTLNATLKNTALLLMKPQELIDVSTLSLCIDRNNQIIKDNEKNKQQRINLAQIIFSDNEKRVALLAEFPRKELITPRIKPVYL